MKNIRASLKPGGRFTQVVWRKREANPWLHSAELCVRNIVPVVSHNDTMPFTAVQGRFRSPGLDAGQRHGDKPGFERIQFERFDSDIP